MSRLKKNIYGQISKGDECCDIYLNNILVNSFKTLVQNTRQVIERLFPKAQVVGRFESKLDAYFMFDPPIAVRLYWIKNYRDVCYNKNEKTSLYLLRDIYLFLDSDWRLDPDVGPILHDFDN